MVPILSKEKHIHSMNSKISPSYYVKQNQLITVETYDCYKNVINPNNNILTEEILNETNPATGPIFINGINEGDILKVEIMGINTNSNGIMYTGIDIGASKKINKNEFSFFNNLNYNEISFNDINIPINKMIGVIGVAPESTSISTSIPGRHGGNLDCKKISENTVLYLPVFHEGALLALGDVHLAMADGELGGTGLEVNAEVDIKCSKAEVNLNIKNPILSNDEGIYYMSSDTTIEKAVESAIQELTELFLTQSSLTTDEITKLFSLVCDIQINQIVNPLKTIRMLIPRYILNEVNIRL